jgi:hypothetical protein
MDFDLRKILVTDKSIFNIVEEEDVARGRVGAAKLKGIR